MRTVEIPGGYSILVSNDEYRLIKKVNANIKLPVESLEPYYQELGDKLVLRGVLNKENENSTDYFVSLKRSK